MLGTRFAARINSFASGAASYWPDQTHKPGLAQMVRRAATVEGLTELDLNWHDHAETDPVEVAAMVVDCGLRVSRLAMRCYSNPGFRRGAFANPAAAVRREPIDLTRRGIDAARAMGAPAMALDWGRTAMTMPFSATMPPGGRPRSQASPKWRRMIRTA